MDKKLQLALSDMQGQLFEMSKAAGYDSESFIKAFMQSRIAKDLDSDFNHLQCSSRSSVRDAKEWTARSAPTATRMVAAAISPALRLM